MLVCDHFIAGWLLKVFFFQQKCVTYITSRYIRYTRELHPIKSLISFLILSIDKLVMRILYLNTITLKGNYLANAKLQLTHFYHRNCKNYKLLNMMTLIKMFYKVKTFSLKLSMLSYL